MKGNGFADEDSRALATMEAHTRAIVEAAVDGIVSIDECGAIQMINPAAQRLFGYDASEVIGRNVKVLMPSPYQEEHEGDLARFLSSGEKRSIGAGREVAGLRKDGTTFPLELSITEARVGDERIFVSIIRDVRDRERPDERFRLVVESAPNAIVMIDAAGVVVLVNSQTETSFGYRREELLGQLVEMLVPERFRASHPGLRAGFFASPGHRPMGAGRDLHGLRKDGSEFPVEIGLNPIVTGEGLFVLAAIVDVTERKRAEQELRLGKESLEQAVAALQAKNDEVRAMTQQLWQAAKLASVGELAASIAHELNNPLATVSLRVESLLGRTPETDPRRRALEVIQQETQRMGNLVANLLQFSRHSGDQISTVDVHQELTAAVELIHHLLRKRQVAVAREFSPDVPSIYADRQKLRQVFLNLLTNASDAMPKGGTLTISTALVTLGAEAAVRIEFRDTGVGIPADYLGKVMDPFFTTKEEGQGTGLGLAICRRIAQEHQGTIDVESVAGKGTTVRLVLPVQKGNNVAALHGAAK